LCFRIVAFQVLKVQQRTNV